MIKQQRKKPMFSITVNKEILEMFNYCSKKYALNKSRFVENALGDYIKNKEPVMYKKYSSKLKDLDFIKT